MATQLQLRRGSTAQVAAFTGAEGELVINTTLKTAYVNDGSTAGGFALARADGSNLAPTSAVVFSDDVTLTGASNNVVWDKSDNTLEFADNAKAKFGTGDDFEIYHNGTDSYLVDSGTGGLYIKANSFLKLQSETSNEDFITCTSDAGVSIFHNDVEKIASTADGATVKGSLLLDLDNAEINLKSGGGGDKGALNWTFTTTDTNYAEVSLDYDTRNTVGLLFKTANYVATIDGGNTIIFKESGSEHMRMDTGGKILMGRTDSASGAEDDGWVFSPNGWAYSSMDGTGDQKHLYFINDAASDATIVGSIATDGSATAYNTSSDKRLKENIADATGSGDLLDAMNVRQFDWKSNGRHEDFGLVAQEVKNLVPNAVSGDADSDDMMQIDYSKLVGLLLAEVKDLRGRVAQLEG